MESKKYYFNDGIKFVVQIFFYVELKSFSRKLYKANIRLYLIFYVIFTI
jgi:hypothetical protein